MFQLSEQGRSDVTKHTAIVQPSVEKTQFLVSRLLQDVRIIVSRTIHRMDVSSMAVQQNVRSSPTTLAVQSGMNMAVYTLHEPDVPQALAKLDDPT